MSVCISLKGNPVITVALTPLETAMLDFVGEFGKNCSVFSTVDNFLGDFKEQAEGALKDIISTATSIFNEVQNVINSINGLLQEGINLLVGYINTAVNAIEAAVAAVQTVMNAIENAIVDATNSLASAACNALNTAITGMPSDVKIQSAGIVASELLDKANPQKFIGGMMDKLGVKDMKNDLLDAALQVSKLPKIPNLKTYYCV